MKDRSLVWHGVFAAIAAGAAYMAWSTPMSSGAEDTSVVMVPGDVERLTAIDFDEEGVKVALAKSGGAPVASVRRGASSLTYRAALGSAAEKPQKISITWGTASRELVQRFADDRAKAYWADAAEPDAKLEQVTSWIDRVLKLRISDLSDAKPTGTPKLIVELHAGRSEEHTSELQSPCNLVCRLLL